MAVRARPTGEKGTAACVRCCKVIRPGFTELPPEPTPREGEKTYGAPKYEPSFLRNQGIV